MTSLNQLQHSDAAQNTPHTFYSGSQTPSARNQAMLDSLARIHHETLIRHVRARSGNVNDAEDTVQDAYLRMLEGLPAAAESPPAFTASSTISPSIAYAHCNPSTHPRFAGRGDPNGMARQGRAAASHRSFTLCSGAVRCHPRRRPRRGDIREMAQRHSPYPSCSGIHE